MRILLMLLLKKIWAEMKEPMLEYLRWTLEFLSWKSNMGFQLQPRNSEAREPTSIGCVITLVLQLSLKFFLP